MGQWIENFSKHVHDTPEGENIRRIKGSTRHKPGDMWECDCGQKFVIMNVYKVEDRGQFWGEVKFHWSAIN